MAKSKISRKKLLKEPDEFITLSGRLIQFGRSRQKEILVGFTAFFIILATISLVRYFSAQSEAEASLLLSRAQAKYDKNLSSKDAEKALNEVEKDFRKLLDDFSGKLAGKQARLIFANIYLDAGKTDQAIELYKTALDDWGKNPALKNSVLSSLGYAYEKKGDLKTAASFFEKIREGNATFGKDSAIYNLGRIYAELDDNKKSMEAYQNLNKNFPNFIYAQIVQEKIRP